MIEISKTLGTILDTMDTMKRNRDIVKISDFCILHIYAGHSDGTQGVSKFLKLKNMMSEVSKTVSNVPIRFLESDFEEVEFW